MPDIPWQAVFDQGGLAVALALSVAANIWQATRASRAETRERRQADIVVAALRDSTSALDRSNDILVEFARRAGP